jgi:hypothetical protein
MPVLDASAAGTRSRSRTREPIENVKVSAALGAGDT